MKDSQQQQQQQQQPQQQPLKFIQVSNVKKKPFKRKKYYPTKSTNNKQQQSKSNPVSSNNNSITCNEHDEQQASHPHVHSTTTCSSSSLSNSNYNNNIQRNVNNSTTLHEMIPSSDANNANLMNMNGNFNGNPMSSSHALDGSTQQHMQQQLTNKHGATSLHVLNNNTMDDASKHSDSSSVGIEHHMHRGSTSSPATMLSSSSNAFIPGNAMNTSNNSMLQFVMEASPKYTTHVAKKRNTLSKDNLIKVLHLSQVQACRVLGCSLSTLKRRFGEVKQELGMEKWPSYYDDVRHLPIFPKLYPMSLQFILNEHECSDIPNCNLIFENAAQLSITFPKPPSSPED